MSTAQRSIVTPFSVSLLLAALVAYLLGPTARQTAVVLGFFRSPANTVLAADQTLSVLEGTTHCEDLHYHQASGLLFTACEDDAAKRHRWFPPLAHFDDPDILTSTARGSLRVIDPEVSDGQSPHASSRWLHAHKVLDPGSSGTASRRLRRAVCDAWNRRHR